MRNKHVDPQKLNQQWRREAARRIQGLKSSELHVLMELIDRGGLRGYCFPSARTLSADTKYSKKTIERCLRRLDALRLIRRTRAIRNDNTRGVNHYAVTLPITLSVHLDGQKEPILEDTESAHNRKTQQKSNTSPYSIPHLENDVFEVLEPILAINRYPELICMYEVTNWLFKRSRHNGVVLSAFILENAADLREEFSVSDLKLQSWGFFVERLNTKSIITQNGLAQLKADKRLSKLALSLLRADLSSEPGNCLQLIEGCSIEEDDEHLVVAVSSLFAKDRLEKLGHSALSKLSAALNQPVRIDCGNTRGQIFYPKSS